MSSKLLKNEIRVPKEARPGLIKLLDSNEEERWVITKYYPQGSVERNLLKFKGKPAAALKAFRSLVQAVAGLHQESIVHRDIKPANVFVTDEDELAMRLGLVRSKNFTPAGIVIGGGSSPVARTMA